MLKKRDFDANYNGKYKEQKAYSFFDSEFIGTINHFQYSATMLFIYCAVTASQKIHKSKQL